MYFGAVAEELGSGLQNHVHGCESRPCLQARASGGMVYTEDLKSLPLKRLWVRIPPRPPLAIIR